METIELCQLKIMSRRSVETKRQDTKNGDRAELLCAISWLASSPKDVLKKSGKEDDIKKHIDWYVYKPDGKLITYDVKSRRFEKYGKGFSPNFHFMAEIKNRQGIAGSIYGEQMFMAHEVSGYFNFIQRKLIAYEVDNNVNIFGVPVNRIDCAYGNIYSNPKYDDGHELTAFAFSDFKVKQLPIPFEFLERQFDYTTDELIAYIKKYKLNMIFND